MPIVNTSDFTSTSFDYLIVGSGAGGLTLAARLSEDPDVVVGVIEAGEYIPDMAEILIPGMIGRTMGNPRVDWSFASSPQSAANNRVVIEPRGKIVGGSTALAWLAYGRGSSAEYNAWESLGNEGWNWFEFLKYFKKSETYSPPPPEVAAKYHTDYSYEYHGREGPIKKTFPLWHNSLHTQFQDTLVGLGAPMNPDGGAGKMTGTISGAFSVDPKTVTRSYAANEHYAPNAERKNLVLLTEAHATKVLLQTEPDGSVVAKGVQFRKDGQLYEVHSKGEVVLSAGIFQTPQLLELSGIGRRHILNKFGIEQVLELPVGENLQEHSWVPFVYEVDSTIETLDNLQNPDFVVEQSKLYQEKKLGMLSSMSSAYTFLPLLSPNGSDGPGGVMASSEHSGFMDRLDQYIASMSTGEPEEKGQRKQVEVMRPWFKDPGQAQIEIFQLPGFFTLEPQTLQPKPGCHYQTLMVGILHPLSRGSVHIISNDPLSKPNVDLGLIQNPLDLEMLVSAVKFSRKIIESEPLKSFAKTKAYDPPEEVLNGDDEGIREWCRKTVQPFYHPFSTAIMLPKEDGGVVDASLKVYGTKNLRVVDASVIPVQISYHPQATVYAIAEKAADIIKKARPAGGF
ncbi:GMC oxidoreductase [Stereum hirsutum FP-91666 SS1]|uniref:GMC oxidoreductase n=1 Tax=Stereum hirsutum (strain FP-91666) TaxID=721885 RepID=UPI000440D071|nr:GMC oxidoreductase [Stereum hirsutum FP-91666 SS1]EIM90734.1 GMC oxidoreductase [Stereum hirsutum FP-91666 SS1]